MNSQLNSFRLEHNIPMTLYKPWYMSRRHFLEVQLQEASRIREAMDLTKKMNERYEKYLNVFARVARDLGTRGEKLIMFQLPEIDYSKLDDAILTLKVTCSKLCFGKTGGAFEQLFFQKDMIAEDIRRDILSQAVANAPRDKRVIVIKTGYMPLKHKRDLFDSEIASLAQNPTNRLVSVKMGDFYEWLGFAPAFMKHDDFYEIVDNWRADPKRIEVSYI